MGRAAHCLVLIFHTVKCYNTLKNKSLKGSWHLIFLSCFSPTSCISSTPVSHTPLASCSTKNPFLFPNSTCNNYLGVQWNCGWNSLKMDLLSTGWEFQGLSYCSQAENSKDLASKYHQKGLLHPKKLSVVYTHIKFHLLFKGANQFLMKFCQHGMFKGNFCPLL